MKTWKTFSIALIKYFFPITWQTKENVAPLLLDWYDFRSQGKSKLSHSRWLFFLQLHIFAYKMCLISTKNTVHAWTSPVHFLVSLGSYFLSQNLPAHIYLDFNRPLLAWFSNFFLTSTLISLVSGDYYYKICIDVQKLIATKVMFNNTRKNGFYDMGYQDQVTHPCSSTTFFKSIPVPKVWSWFLHKSFCKGMS